MHSISIVCIVCKYSGYIFVSSTSQKPTYLNFCVSPTCTSTWLFCHHSSPSAPTARPNLPTAWSPKPSEGSCPHVERSNKKKGESELQNQGLIYPYILTENYLYGKKMIEPAFSSISWYDWYVYGSICTVPESSVNDAKMQWKEIPFSQNSSSVFHIFRSKLL